MDPNDSIDLSAFGSDDQGAGDQGGNDQDQDLGGQGQGSDFGSGDDQGDDQGTHGAGDDGDDEGPGDRGLGDDADDDSDEWGETREDDEDDEDNDEPNPADDRETWRKQRLNKVRDQRDAARRQAAARESEAATARRELEEMRERLSVYEAGGTPPARQQQQRQAPAQDAIPDMTAIQRYVAENDPTCIALAKQVEAIKAKADTFPDAGTYLEALSEAQTEYKAELRDKSREVRQNLESRQRATQTNSQAYVTRLVENYEAAIEASTLPRIETYARRLNENAEKLHPTIREAVLTYEHQDIATAAITSNRAAFDWLVEATKEAKGGPLHPRAVAYVGELIAAYREGLDSTGPASSRREDRSARRSEGRGLPRQLRGRPSGGQGMQEDENPFQHARDVLAGRKKDPELRRASY